MKKKYLFLHLKGEHFDAIKDGRKVLEYRLYNDYWKKRLLIGSAFKDWEKIIIRRGYPRADDYSKQIMRPWRGARFETITHPHFGPDPVKVFAIVVN